MQVAHRAQLGWRWSSRSVAGSLPYCSCATRRTRRTRLFEDQFPQAIDLIAGSLRAGHAFTTGVSMVGDEVAGSDWRRVQAALRPAELRHAAARRAQGVRRTGAAARRRFFITAVLTQREAGGNLAEVLDNLAGLIRERSRVKRQVRVASAHGRITGWVLSMMPPALFLVMMLIAPEHMNTFVTDPLGVRMILVALVLQVIGTLAIRRIVNVEF